MSIKNISYIYHFQMMVQLKNESKYFKSLEHLKFSLTLCQLFECTQTVEYGGK